MNLPSEATNRTTKRLGLGRRLGRLFSAHCYRKDRGGKGAPERALSVRSLRTGTTGSRQIYIGVWGISPPSRQRPRPALLHDNSPIGQRAQAAITQTQLTTYGATP